MKTKILKLAILCAIAFNLTGCIRHIEGGVQVPTEGQAERNNNTKLYYEDTNNTAIKEDMKNIVSFLNKDVIVPDYIAISKTPEEVNSDLDFKFAYSKNNNGKSLDLKFNADGNSNYIVANKKYSSRNEAYLDFHQLWQYFFEQTNKSPELKDKLNTSGDMFFIDENALNSGILKFTTKREIVRQAISDKILRAYSNSGYIMVNNPNDADKKVYFQLTRDFKSSELEKLKKEGKNINLGVIQNGMSNQVNLMQTSMNIASLNNSSGSSVGIGLAVGVVAGILTNQNDPNLIMPSIKIDNIKENKSYLLNRDTLSRVIIKEKDSKFIASMNSDEENSLFYSIRKTNLGETDILTPLN